MKVKGNLVGVFFDGAMVILTKETLHLTSEKEVVRNIN